MSEVRTSTCHCGSVELEIEFENGLQNIRRCDCSLCSRKGYIMASVPTTHLKIIKGREVLNYPRFPGHQTEGTLVPKEVFDGNAQTLHEAVQTGSGKASGA
ncbi:MAG: hypothetical protein ACRD22_07280, partial [Terriglobia bacterium]